MAERWNVYAVINKKRQVTGYQAFKAGTKLDRRKFIFERSNLSREQAEKIVEEKTDILNAFFQPKS